MARSHHRRIALAIVCVLASSCGARQRRPGALPAPIDSATLGAGDRIEVVVYGEEKFPKEYQVNPDGSVDFPWIHRQHVVGMEPQALAAKIRDLLIEGKYLRDPVVIVSVKEYNSKHVTIGGAVTKPGVVPYTPGLTLFRLISGAGGFTPTANRDNVLVTRTLTTGERKTVSYPVEDIAEGRSSDVPLQSGDSVYVYERAF